MISRMLLQLTKDSSMQASEFKYKAKNLGVPYGDHRTTLESEIQPLHLHGTMNKNLKASNYV